MYGECYVNHGFWLHHYHHHPYHHHQMMLDGMVTEKEKSRYTALSNLVLENRGSINQEKNIRSERIKFDNEVNKIALWKFFTWRCG